MRDFAHAEIRRDLLIIPDLASPDEGALTRSQVMILEAIHILALGLDGVAVDIRAAKALLARSWKSQAHRRHFQTLVTLGLLDQVGWTGDSPLYALTHEGRLERFSQRVGVFA
ncbi:hypothetical protein [Brevundimonas sp.]|uniref:hypothetical protein n=1 Tax=Brevundimonas sp. TaxID=1871086 RepID=UPI00289E31D6|nr:hypothetical protein [Brevundimonas sp.]